MNRRKERKSLWRYTERRRRKMPTIRCIVFMCSLNGRPHRCVGSFTILWFLFTFSCRFSSRVVFLFLFTFQLIYSIPVASDFAFYDFYLILAERLYTPLRHLAKSSGEVASGRAYQNDLQIRRHSTPTTVKWFLWKWGPLSLHPCIQSRPRYFNFVNRNLRWPVAFHLIDFHCDASTSTCISYRNAPTTTMTTATLSLLSSRFFVVVSFACHLDHSFDWNEMVHSITNTRTHIRVYWLCAQCARVVSMEWKQNNFVISVCSPLSFGIWDDDFVTEIIPSTSSFIMISHILYCVCRLCVYIWNRLVRAAAISFVIRSTFTL